MSKRARDPDASSGSDNEKATKKSKKDDAEILDESDDGKTEWELGKMRKVSLNEFKGRVLVDIREFYSDAGGDIKPGKKGISLSPEQWEALKAAIPKVDAALKKKGK